MEKYWIESYGLDEAHHCRPHGNPWFVFTEIHYLPYNRNQVISIPYHANISAYANNEYEDFCDHPEAWEEWLSYTIEQRREYIRDFRRKQKLNTINGEDWANSVIARFQGLKAQHAAANMFVTFPPATVAGCDTSPTTKEENMNEFYTERQSLSRAARDAFFTKDTEAKKHFHIDPDRPKTTREALEWIAAKHYKPIDEKTLDRKLEDYEDPLNYIEFRKHAADHDGYSAARDKATKAFAAVKLDIDVLPPTEALSKVRTFESHTFH